MLFISRCIYWQDSIRHSCNRRLEVRLLDQLNQLVLFPLALRTLILNCHNGNWPRSSIPNFQPQDLEIVIESSEGFMFSGQKQMTMRLLPFDHQVIFRNWLTLGIRMWDWIACIAYIITIFYVHKTFVRPRLEHAVAAWSPWQESDIKCLEKNSGAIGQRGNVRRKTQWRGAYNTERKAF